MLQINDVTRTFYKFIFPSKKRILYTPKTKYETNNVIFKNIILFGFQGSGKTLTAMRIVEEAIKKYGIEKVNAIISEEGDLEELIYFGLQNKLVNILFADNLTLRKIKEDVLRDYFRIRHLYYERFKQNVGYILSILSVHRFHGKGCPIELRTNMDGLIVKDTSLNPYDYHFIKRMIGEDLLNILKLISEYKNRNPRYKKYSVFVSKYFRGVVSFPIPKHNYFKRIEYGF